MEESKTTYAKNTKTIEPLMCKITKIKRTKYNAQKDNQQNIQSEC